MKKAKAKQIKPKEEKDEEITNPFYGISMEQAVDKIVKAGKPRKEKLQWHKPNNNVNFSIAIQ